MSNGSSRHQPIQFLPEIVCEAIPAPGLSLTPRRDSDKDGQGGQTSPSDVDVKSFESDRRKRDREQRRLRNAQSTAFWNGWTLMIGGLMIALICATKEDGIKGKMLGALMGIGMAMTGRWAVRYSDTMKPDQMKRPGKIRHREDDWHSD